MLDLPVHLCFLLSTGYFNQIAHLRLNVSGISSWQSFIYIFFQFYIIYTNSFSILLKIHSLFFFSFNKAIFTAIHITNSQGNVTWLQGHIVLSYGSHSLLNHINTEAYMHSVYNFERFHQGWDTTSTVIFKIKPRCIKTIILCQTVKTIRKYTVVGGMRQSHINFW